MNSHVAFDLEIVKELPDGGDWEPYRPFGISIISTCTDSWDFRTWPLVPEEYRYPLELSEEQTLFAVRYLQQAVAKGYKIITINGLGFDFRVLAEHLPNLPQIQKQIAELACSEHHIDIGFAMVCELGFMCGMQAMCDGFNLPGKSEGVTGKLIPAMWKSTLADQEKCLEYCRNDVAMTSLVYQSILHHKRLIYKTKTGIIKSWMPTNLHRLDVASMQKLPEVDKPFWPRSKFTDWLGLYL